MLTPPEVGRQLGIDAAKVLRFIRAGELVASDLANLGSRRPRWRIAPEALKSFLERRQSRPAPTITRRRQRDPRVKEFF
jgi:hypothetical protein